METPIGRCYLQLQSLKGKNLNSSGEMKRKREREEERGGWGSSEKEEGRVEPMWLPTLNERGIKGRG